MHSVDWPLQTRSLELDSGFIFLREIVREEVVAFRLHGTQDGTVQARVVFLIIAMVLSDDGVEAETIHTSEGLGLSPGRSENRNRSYAFAQMFASGKTSYESTAVTFGLFGCLRFERSKLSLAAANDASMSRICAERETSMGASVAGLCSPCGDWR